MCFAPQRRALFRHRNFEKCSEREVLLLSFSLANVLRSTTALAALTLFPSMQRSAVKPEAHAERATHLVYGQPPRVHIKLPWGHLSVAGGLAEGS